ncbi:hypothetical protein E2320_007319 [Naja naja]|nr:hypothetical protein E2320_007319 [Naja naja]
MEGYEGNWEDWMFSGVSVNDSEFQNGTTDYLVTLPIWAVYRAHEWIFGTCMCKIASALKEVNFYSGVLLLAFISFDRHLAIVYATRAATQKKHWVKFVCTGIWLLAFRFSLPVIHFWEAFKLSNFSNRVCYVNIGGNQTTEWRGSIENFTSVLVFVICWLPYNIALLSDTLLRLQYFTETCSVRERIDEALSSSEILGVAHSCINPIIYAFIGQKFRNNCLKILVSRGIISKEMLMRYRKGSTYSSPSGTS